jgi:hypothetical protein
VKRFARSGLAGFVMIAVIAFGLASASARVGDRPTISGDPVVGETLTSSDAGNSGVYRWQRCDPATANCEDGGANDPDWTDILGASGNNVKTYTLVDADSGHFIRVLAKGTSLGEKFVSSEPFGPVTGGAPPPTQPLPPLKPEPQHGINVIGSPANGTVEFKPPGQTGFSPVGDLTTIPVNSLIDTRGSEIQLTAALGPYASDTEDKPINFGGGLFRILQSGDVNSPAVAKLVQKLACGKGAGEAKASAGGPVAQEARRRRRRLWGSGSGNYGTSGRGGTGSVVGTTWLTQDTCKGTLFYVADGIGINVFDFSAKKTFPLGPGQKKFLPRD